MTKHITLVLAVFFSMLTASQAQIIITAVFDADLPGGLPKGVELYTTEDIADMSIFGLGSANNGGGTDSIEFTFPAVPMSAFAYVYVSSDSVSFADFFGFNSDFPNVDAMLINGDDAVELFMNGDVIDVFGDINNDGSGSGWEYKDGWAARKNSTSPDGSAFEIQNWNFSGVGGLSGEETNAGAETPVPIMMYNDSTSGGGPDVTILTQNLTFVPRDITIEVGQTVRWSNPETTVEHNVNGGQDVYPCNPVSFLNGAAAVGPWDFDVTFVQPGFYNYQCDPHVSFDMLGTVTVVDPNAPDYPMYDIASLTSENTNGVADSLGVSCQIEATVYGENTRPPGLLFTVIDDSGVGMSVFKNNADCYEVKEGDRLIVKGTVAQFSGLTQIDVERQVEVLSSGNALLQPTLIEEALGVATKSRFIKIENVVVDTVFSTGASGWNVMTSNENANYFLRLDSDVFDEPGVAQGDVLTVTGIGGQFDPSLPHTEGYLLAPRRADDIEIILSTNFLPASSIAMYPNPTSEKIYFETDLLIESIIVYNSNGALVAFEKDNQMDVASFAPGLYVVKVNTGDGVWTDRFIKID
jgi:plastocyanin